MVFFIFQGDQGIQRPYGRTRPRGSTAIPPYDHLRDLRASAGRPIKLLQNMIKVKSSRVGGPNFGQCRFEWPAQGAQIRSAAQAAGAQCGRWDKGGMALAGDRALGCAERGARRSLCLFPLSVRGLSVRSAAEEAHCVGLCWRKGRGGEQKYREKVPPALA